MRGYKGCEMGHFVGGGEYIDPLRNTNVECDSKLNNPELAYIALLYSVYTSKLSIKASLELGKLLLNRVNNLYPLSTTIFHSYFYISNINKPIQPHSHVHAQHLQPSLTIVISNETLTIIAPEVRLKPSWTALRRILSVQHKKDERPCSTLILLGASSNRKCGLKCNVL